MYDLKGGYNLTGVVISGSMWKTVDKVPFFSYLSVLLILGMLAFLSLNAITLCISAYQDSMFGAVIAVGVLAVSLTKGILHYKVKQVV